MTAAAAMTATAGAWRARVRTWWLAALVVLLAALPARAIHAGVEEPVHVATVSRCAAGS